MMKQTAIALAFSTLALPTFATPPALAQGAAAPLAGFWAQHSSGPELVAVPAIRLVPNSGGSGLSPALRHETRPVTVDRTMSLEVRPDGTFRWRIDKTRAGSQSDASCRVATREEKLGRVQVSGSQLIVTITGGTASAADSCNPARNQSSPVPPGEERYVVAIGGSSLRMTGSGGVDWTFARR
ncbi:MAG: hypothetical protein J0H01_27150 [Rhizobiales bacterium]|nr:hypothetical protein [Hyphomicrobiales bacterium]